MTKITSIQAIAGALLACGLSAAPAAALANRTFDSGKGTDAGACALAAPCRSFAFALTQTNPGGEIDVLDPADYGPMIIAKAISIVNDGVGTAGITAGSDVNAIAINAGPSDSVHLRGLTIEGLGTGTNGILFNTGGNLAIENCVIRGFGGAGIIIRPTGSAVVTGVLSKVTANNNGAGIDVQGGTSPGASVNVTIVDSVASNNSGGGVYVNSSAAPGVGATAVMVRKSVASYNGTGLIAVSGNAILRVGHSVVTGNATGVNATGVQAFGSGTLFSYGDNDIDGNSNNNTGVLTPLAMH